MIASLLISVVELSDKIVQTLNSTLGIWYLIILNAFGVIAIVSKTLEYQQKSKKYIFLFATISAFCWVAYFIVQGDFASTFASLITALDILVYMQRGKHKWAENKLWAILFVVLQLVFGVLSFNTWHDVFAILGGTLIVISYSVKDKKTYRIISAIGLAYWVANSISKMYVIALINDTFGLISVIVSLLRFYVFNRKDQTKEDSAS